MWVQIKLIASKFQPVLDLYQSLTTYFLLIFLYFCSSFFHCEFGVISVKMVVRTMILGMRQGRGSIGISSWRYSKARRCLKNVALESLEYASEAESRLIRLSSQIGHQEILPLGYLARLESPFYALKTIRLNKDKKEHNSNSSNDPMSPYIIGVSSLYLLAVALCESRKGILTFLF